MSQQLQGQIRTVIAFIGGYAVSQGWVDESTAMAMVGIATTVVVSIWSWKSKTPIDDNPLTK